MSAATATILTIAATAATAGTALASAHMASSANKEAAKLQKSSTDQALGYEKERDTYARGTESNRYGQMMQQNAPYVAQGQGASNRMGDLLGLPASPTMPPASGAPGQSGGLITMRAPDGSTKQVPADHEQHYTERGAQRVG